jgi:hypothetical protein
MALVLADRVQETSTTAGTGTLTLAGALTGYQTFSAGIGNGNACYYTITNAAGSWEVGIGTYTSSGNTLSRTTVLSSSNSGSLVSFTGTLNVFVTYPAERSIYQDESTATAYSAQFASSNGLTLNSATVSTSYTLPTGYNAVSAGPVTVASGVTVTVPSGSTWVVV